LKSALLKIDQEVSARGLSVTAKPARLQVGFQCDLVKGKKKKKSRNVLRGVTSGKLKYDECSRVTFQATRDFVNSNKVAFS